MRQVRRCRRVAGVTRGERRVDSVLKQRLSRVPANFNTPEALALNNREVTEENFAEASLAFRWRKRKRRIATATS
jgi:hypothetical protein